MPAEIMDYRLVLTALRYALIEIRAAENLRKAQSLADVFHNVPNGIASGRSPEDIRAHLNQTAARLGCEDYINGLFDSAVKNMER
ncbi:MULTISPECIES: hypothetical protein [unclassified Rhizobium]|uniref:hypothetical protein n=1 Tax=unclassified Rhizobium TaxID=2613769 RepID=UPI001AE2A2D5|nr:MULTISPECIES: hypothetical protein [unclassified Rhizobium]MBP2461436.1 hypothetical protein [Rhizobium sp. PvP014]MBP2528832.1 hypothetical protein [Rhizobium sp. PvP099]